MKKIIVLVGLAVLLPLISSAHGLVTTKIAQSNGYVLEFEYSNFGNVVTGDLVTYDVYLLDQNQQPVNFDGAYIKLAKTNGEPALVASLQEAPDTPGSARMSGLLKDPGDYTAEVHINKDKQIIAQATYDFKVDQGNTALVSGTPAADGNNKIGLIAAIAGIVGLGIGLAIGKRRKNK